VPDGATLVIGGLMDSELELESTGLPYLNRLPVVGYLFGRHTKKLTRKELMVLMTTHIWNPKGGCPVDESGPMPPGLAPPDWLPNQSDQIPFQRPDPELLPSPSEAVPTAKRPLSMAAKRL
jgi:Bacterial type II and III secretion system protein